MAARNEAKIKFTAETREFTSQIREANSTLATLRAGMSLNEAQFKNTGNAAEFLKNKQSILKQEIEQNRIKQEALNSKLEAAKRIYGENSTEAQSWSKKLTQAKTEEQKLETQLKETNDAIEDQAKAEREAATPLEKLNKKIDEQRKDLQTLKTEYANVALAEGKDSQAARDLESKIESLNSELDQNEQKLKDVTQATEQAGDTAENEAKGGWSVAGNILSNLASGAISTLTSKLKEAVVAVINLGTEFTASMSNVQALSGASAGEMAQLEAAAKELGRTTIFSASQVSDSFGYMALAGWDTQEMLSGIDGVLNLAATSGMELADAADMVTDYLSAFGLEASDAAGMVDMLSYAQAHSNTTAEQLGQAYGNCAASAHTAGQSMQTTTAILESWANQGLKGAEAGTAFSAMVRDITQKMKDGKIMIGDTAIEVQKANGDFRSMTDILADVEAATNGMGTAEKSAALMTTFTARSVKGVSMALTEGSEKIAGYEADLNSCTGTAEEMAGVMNDNLAGDMKALGSAAEGLGLQLFEYFEGPLRGAAQIATDALNWLTDAITPNENALTRFIDETQGAIDQNKTAIEAAEQAVDDMTSNIGEMEIYKETLLELLDKSELNELEQFRLKDAVEQLSDSVPGLKDAYDEVNGTFQVSNEEIIEMINNAEAMALKTALIEAQKESYKNYADAIVNAAKASQALTKATEDYANAEEYTYSGVEGMIAIGGEASRNLSDQARAVREAGKAYNEAGENLEQAKKDMEVLPDAINSVADAYGIDLANAADTAAESMDGVGDAAGDMATDVTGASDLTEEELEAIEQAAAEAEAAFKSMRDGVESSMQDALSFVEGFNGGVQLSSDEILANLQSTGAGVAQWAENMAILGEQAGSGMSQEFYDELLQMGPASANIVQELVNTLNNDKPKFKEISDQYAENLRQMGNADNLAKYSSAGKAAADQTTQGIKDNSGQVTQAAKDMVDSATSTADAQMQSGISNMRANAQMGMNEVNNAVLIQLETMKGHFSSAMSVIQGNVAGMIGSVRSALSQPLYGPDIKVPHFSMYGNFDAKTKSVPVVHVSWYAKGAIFTQPTLFNTAYGMKGVGEAGPEAVLPIDLLRDYISEAMEAKAGTVVTMNMTVNGAEDPESWAAEAARSIKQYMRIG